MRLICPNCDAQYEVPDDVIPVEGRDVQCSNCGTTWFQTHPSAIAKQSDEMHEDDQPGPFEERSAPRGQDSGDALTAPEEDDFEETPQVDSASRGAQLDPNAEPEDEPAQDAPERKLEPSIEAILRAEAEREAAARQKEADRIETQPDLGLDAPQAPPASAPPVTKEPAAHAPTPDQPPRDLEPTDVAGSRRDLLPDIEEINSTLRPSQDRSLGQSRIYEAEQNARSQTGRKPFRSGFLITIVLGLACVLTYMFNREIAEAIPELNSALSMYVIQIDMARDWLDERIVDLLTWLDETAAASNSQ